MVLSLQQFSFTPKDNTQPILGPIDLQLKQGEWLVVLGGNGSGKSLLAQLLAGWYPDLLTGSVQGLGRVQNIALDKSRLVSLAPGRQLIQQSPQLQLSGCAFTVEQEIAFGPENLGLSDNEIQFRVKEAMALTQCEYLRFRSPSTLSGGEAQRVVIASALAMRPKLLLLDEAFSRLTPNATEQLQQRIKQYAQACQCSVIIFERNLLPAITLSEQFLLLEAGKTKAAGSLEDIFPFLFTTINAPDAWQALNWLIENHHWNKNIVNNDKALLNAFKEFYVTAQ
ncbi:MULTISPECIES: energy-coupling factor ABC transporter ATP-binding protein [Enterobacterales]|uniref:energy-coupling factor ABC transporter ATP-binding protein n=1 Tax=Enterobacterales TaxID=91347 RepID=UPI0008482D7E|nr:MULTISPECIES: energy-coupling factor ABC transporter ATP-binding protein [Enterobacterales]WOO48160.1 energy-coupling factor ABC transporter ATP-binding protein [Hafnia alvei]ODQ05375.1 cobalt ABC transporter ATP-binding protein [Shigella sp. FC130]OEI92825.1 cobalt ABC transporter ATP-binding protein [Shigella sp. FC1655]OEJ07974.1 cobalt ABC transporter ATP-binding protein [Shigella sp. FC1967]WPF02623.1 energy-coupling factor ABC transporter ATP-binding protein [Proteus vulgaris]